MDKYIENLGIYIGEFKENDVKNGKMKKAIDEAMQKTGLKYTNSKITKNSIKIWICTVQDFKL